MRKKLKFGLGITLILTLVLTGILVRPTHADNDSTISVKIGSSCAFGTVSGNNHNTTVANGTYQENIGKTTMQAFCNDSEGFAIYAIGFSNSELGNNKLLANIGGTLTPSADIATGTATSGNTSNWAMKVSAVAGTYAPTIGSDTNGSFANYHVVPNGYTKVASFASKTDLTTGSNLETTYAAFVNATQPAGTYTGKVKYTLVHPNDALAPSYTYLDTGETINLKLKSLASGTNVTNIETPDNNIKAFVRSATLPANFTPSSANTISLATSPAPVYIWFDSTTGTMSYYSESETLYVYSNSMFTFYHMEALTDISGLASWEVGEVGKTDMEYMFTSTQISDLTPIKDWNVENVTGMSYIFSETQISDLTPIKDWNVGNVTDMKYMFASTQISDLTPIKDWNVGNVTDMTGVFYGARISDLAPLANWNVGNVTSMAGMFYDVPTLINPTAISGWNVSKVTNFSSMFGGSTPKTNLPIFTSRPGTWNASGTYTPN